MQEIEISKLRIHPKNMRTTYEGIEELTESIKSNGILQNLTVVPDPIQEGYYLVVIGNRRLTAARKAGIKTAPCVVIDIPEKEQLAMMLSENMQRKDMDIIDECKGVQMTLDMGFDVDELAKKTGLSKKTIIRRKNIADMELNYSEVRHRQITIGDLEQLQRVKDSGVRQDILLKIGTDDFHLAITEYERSVKLREWQEKMRVLFRGVATERKEGMRYNEYETIEYFYENKEKKLGDIDIKDGYTYFYHFTDFGNMMYLYGVPPKKEEEENEEDDSQEADTGEEQRKLEEQKNEEQERRAKVKELKKIFHQMRREFIESKSSEKFLSQKRALYWLAYCTAYGDVCTETDTELYAELVGEAEPEDYWIVPEYIADLIMKDQHEAIPYIYAMLEDGDLPIDWRGLFKEKSRSHILYRFMKDIGYTISSEEQKVLEGTHEIYRR